MDRQLRLMLAPLKLCRPRQRCCQRLARSCWSRIAARRSRKQWLVCVALNALCLTAICLLVRSLWPHMLINRIQPTEPTDIYLPVPVVGGERQFDGNRTEIDTEHMLFNYSGSSGVVPRYYGSQDMKYPLLVDMPQLVWRLSRGLPPPPGIVPINQLHSPWFIRHPGPSAGGCNGTEFLLVLVKSHPDNYVNRAAIRSSWAAPDCWPRPVRVFFLLGASALDPSWRPRLARENACHGDLLVRSFTDQYYNNTVKLMSGIEWADDHCSAVRFVAFLDDDFALSPRPAVDFLAAVSTSPAYRRFIGGWVWRQAVPRRRTIYTDGSKWDVSFAEYPWATYPPYVAAGAMFVARPVLAAMRIAMQYTKYLRFDDIFIGLVLHKLALTPVHMDMAMSFKPVLPNCTDSELSDLVATHGYRDPVELMQLWRRIATVTGLTCSTSVEYVANPGA